MDPNEAYRLWLNARNAKMAVPHALALKEWLDKGGFEPNWKPDNDKQDFLDWCDSFSYLF
jgi:hypothetical protein